MSALPLRGRSLAGERYSVLRQSEISLNTLSTEFRDRFVQSFPHLASLIEERDDGSLHIRIPHPRIPSGLVISTARNDLTIGFRDWHTHGDVLTAYNCGSPLDCTVAFVEWILTDEVLIAISIVNGGFRDAWVTDDPEEDRRYVQPNEQLLIGSWSELASSAS